MWKVCVIDDEMQVVNGLLKIIPWQELELEHAGSAADGAAGFELVMSRMPDIVITDIYMPVVNGLEMIQRLRSAGYAGRIVILSGYSDFEYAREALRLKVDDYLSKPITARTLEATLAKLIEGVEDEQAERVKQDEMIRRLLAYEPFVRQERLKRLLAGGQALSPGEENEEAWYAVIAIEIRREQRLENADAADFYLFRFAVGNIIQEIVGKRLPGAEWIELHSYHSGILVRGDERRPEGERTARLRQVCDEMTASVKQYLNVSIRTGIGGWKRGARLLAESAEEALRCMLHKDGETGEARGTAAAPAVAGSPDSAAPGTSPEKQRHRQAIEYVIDYIHHHYADELSLEVLASKVYISRYYLGHLFRKVVGVSFNHYVTRVRMEKAKALLQEGHLLIYEVAERVGYKNVPYFSSLFKKFVGCNPTDYTN